MQVCVIPVTKLYFLGSPASSKGRCLGRKATWPVSLFQATLTLAFPHLLGHLCSMFPCESTFTLLYKGLSL